MEVCRHFAKGNCAFGTACRLAHVRAGDSAARGSRPQRPPPQEEQQLELEEERIDPYDNEPCTFRQMREKYFGLYCEADMRKYWQTEMRPTGNSRPVLRAVSSTDGASRQLCKFFLKGSCQFGASCRNLHVQDVAQLDGELAPELPGGPPPPAPEPEWRDPWATGESAEDCLSRRGRPGEGVECGICFESVLSRGEQFGMLENCDHAFCLSCIRAWRKQKEQQDRVNLRMCPLCRNESFFVVPCDRLILDPEDKMRAVQRYKQQMSLVPCKAFDYGRGKCPLGTSCFYAHLNPDGTRYKPPPARKMEGAGGRQVIGEVKLSDFLSEALES